MINIDPKKLCIECKQPLSYSLIAMDLSEKIYFCMNKDCRRCGLITLVHQEADTKENKTEQGGKELIVE